MCSCGVADPGRGKSGGYPGVGMTSGNSCFYAFFL